MDISDTTEFMGRLKCYPDKRRPLVTLYGEELSDGSAVYRVKWKNLSTGKWDSKKRRKKKDAENLALEVLASLRSPDSETGQLLTKSDQERLELARAIPIDRLRQIAADCRSLRGRIAFSEWVEQYLEIINPLSKRTRKDETTRARYLATVFGDTYLDSLSVEQVEDWYRCETKRISERTGERISQRHANNTLDVLNRILGKARDRRYLPKGETATELVTKTWIAPTDVEILDLPTAKAFLQNLPENPKVATFIIVGMFAGLRPAELEGVISDRYGIDWEDIHFEEKYIHVRSDVAGKKTGERFVEMPPALIELLLPYREPSGNVCLKRAHEYASIHYRELGVIDKWVQDVMRHSYCSYLLAKTQDIGYVADQAGNSPGTIKKNYRRPLPKVAGENYFDLHNNLGEGKIIKMA